MYRLLPLLCCAALAGCIEYFPELPDVGPIADDGMVDDGTPEAGTPEAGTPEAGTPEAGTPEAGTPEAGILEAGPPEAGIPDVGRPDAMCLPADEVCDGIDDDCDGTVDEDVPGCDPGCDAIDDDDDGRTDEGCAAVTCGGGDGLPPCNGAAPGLEIPSGWVYIPPGEVQLGSPEAEADGAAVDEYPQQPAQISRGFLMMQTELTQGMWRELAAGDPIAQGSPSYFDGVDGRICDADAPDQCPVERISWIDAAWAANALSRRDGFQPCYDSDTLDTLANCNGRVGSGCAPGNPTCGLAGCDAERLDTLRDVGGCSGYRLPTSTEWVHAARAGTDTRFWSGDDPADLRAVEWFGAHADGHSHRVGGPPVPDARSHPWGLYDMHGNVAELVHEAYGPLPAPPPVGGMLDPLLLAQGGDSRQIRGCSWDVVNARNCRAAIRAPMAAHQRYSGVGVRLMRPLAPPPLDPPRIIALTAQSPEPVRPSAPVTLDAEAEGGRGGLTGTLYLISPQSAGRSRSQAVGDFIATGRDRWQLTVDWSAINAFGPVTFGPDGTRRRVAARFADADGRADLAYLWLDFVCGAEGEETSACGGACEDQPGEACEVGCDHIDDDGDGRSDEGCAEVTCGDPQGDDPVPPCNGAPGGTEIPSGWVYVPPGTFELGSPPEEGGHQAWLEAPQQMVTIDRPLLMMRAELTRGAWRAMDRAARDPSYFDGIEGPACDGAAGDDCPVERISWLDAVWYANARSVAAWLTPCYDAAALAALEDCNGGWGGGCPAGEALCEPAIEGCDPDDLAALHAMPACDGFRLPTDAEWEYAARAGAGGIRWSGRAPLADVAWFADNADEVTHPVARPPSDAGDGHPWGLHDMYGNVWEWTHDHFGPWPAPPPAVAMRDPLALPAALPYHGLRGCGFADEAYLCRSAQRLRAEPTARSSAWGVRLVREYEPPAVRPGPTLAGLEVDPPPDGPGEPVVLPDEPLVLVARPLGGDGPLTGVLYLLGAENQPSIALHDFIDGGDGSWEVTVEWDDVNAIGPVDFGRDGISRRLVARFADANGRGALAHVDVRFACAVDGEPTGACLGACLPDPDAVCDAG